MVGNGDCHAIGGYDRLSLAQLCRGFLLLQSSDSGRAKTFLVAFLDASQDEESEARSAPLSSWSLHDGRAQHGIVSVIP
jgi:hypothetical protein